MVWPLAAAISRNAQVLKLTWVRSNCGAVGSDSRSDGQVAKASHRFAPKSSLDQQCRGLNHDRCSVELAHLRAAMYVCVRSCARVRSHVCMRACVAGYPCGFDPLNSCTRATGLLRGVGLGSCAPSSADVRVFGGAGALFVVWWLSQRA
eukprot:4034962-Alexandrium_andersonii.AAC.1